MIKNYLVIGIGNVIATEEEEGLEHFIISRPAVASMVPASGGGLTWSLNELVPLYLKNPASAARGIELRKSLVLFSGAVGASMESLYKSWDEKFVRLTSSIILPPKGRAI